MKKKLLAGILALALCSTNMPPQTIFAGEFTSGTPDVVSEEETPEIFTNEEQEAAGETEEELSVFSSEEVPEFNGTPDEAMAAAENAQIKEIDLINSSEVTNRVYTISSAGGYKFTCSNQQTTNRIVVDGTYILGKDNINIYLDNVNINTSAGPALQIAGTVKAKVTIYLTGTNNLITTNRDSAGLQKDNKAQLIIINASNTTTGILKASSDGLGAGAGIGGSLNGFCSNITINSGSVTASSTWGAGIGGGLNGSCSDITINGGSVKASSVSGSPTNAKGEKVYCCTIENPNSEDVIIDVDGTSTSWKPQNHKAVDPDDKYLYAWLIGKTHTISVGSKTQTYYVNKNSNEFKPITNNDFILSSAYLTYNGTAQAPLECKIEDIKDEIELSYYENNVLQPNGAINAGTYTVKANIA